MVIGEVDGVRGKCDPDPNWTLEQACAVATRGQIQKARKMLSPLKVRDVKGDVEVTPEILTDLQQKDETLDKVRNSKKVREKKNSQSWYTQVGDILYRIYKTNSKTLNQVVVPETLRQQVMALAHESLMGGHLGTKKTIDKIKTSFYWPGIYGDVVRFCKSCDVCQRTIQKGKVTKVSGKDANHM